MNKAADYAAVDGQKTCDWYTCQFRAYVTTAGELVVVAVYVFSGDSASTPRTKDNDGRVELVAGVAPPMRPQSAERCARVYPWTLDDVDEIVDYGRRVAGDNVDAGWIAGRFAGCEATLRDVDVAALAPTPSGGRFHFVDEDAPPSEHVEPMPPLVVEPDPAAAGAYLVIDGSNRYRRALAAGLTTLPCYVVSPIGSVVAAAVNFDLHSLVYAEAATKRRRRKAKNPAVAKPEALRDRMKGVTLKKDVDGFYVCTHRARSKSYPAPERIPAKVVREIEETG